MNLSFLSTDGMYLEGAWTCAEETASMLSSGVRISICCTADQPQSTWQTSPVPSAAGATSKAIPFFNLGSSRWPHQPASVIGQTVLPMSSSVTMMELMAVRCAWGGVWRQHAGPLCRVLSRWGSEVCRSEVCRTYRLGQPTACVEDKSAGTSRSCGYGSRGGHDG